MKTMKPVCPICNSTIEALEDYEHETYPTPTGFHVTYYGFCHKCGKYCHWDAVYEYKGISEIVFN